MTTPPRCRYCGKPIAKRTRVVWLHTPEEAKHMPETRWSETNDYYRNVLIDQLPRTKADCQRLSNWQVVSVSRSFRNPDLIDRFGEWDGESYADPYFCTGDHAKRFGEFAARSGKVATKAYHEAVMKDYEDV